MEIGEDGDLYQRDGKRDGLYHPDTTNLLDNVLRQSLPSLLINASDSNSAQRTLKGLFSSLTLSLLGITALCQVCNLRVEPLLLCRRALGDLGILVHGLGESGLAVDGLRRQISSILFLF